MEVAKAKNTSTLFFNSGQTVDIQAVILEVSQDDIRTQTAQQAKKYPLTYKGLEQIWKDVKFGITYKEDPDGIQWIKEPARLYSDGQGDCKSFTLFIVSILQNLGLDYTIRFTSYNKYSDLVTHVYPIAYLNGRAVILDAVYSAFDEQKPYYHKEDFTFKQNNMTKIYRLSGIGNSQSEQEIMAKLKEKELYFQKLSSQFSNKLLEDDITEWSEGEFLRRLNAATFEGKAKFEPNNKAYPQLAKFLKEGNISGIHGIGIGNVDLAEFANFIQQTERLTAKAFIAPTVIFNPEDIVSGIGASKAKQILDKIKKPIQQVANAVKEAFKKVVNWVFKEGIKFIAPIFLFSFIKRKVSKRVDARKAKADRFVSWVAKATGTDVGKVKASISTAMVQKTGKKPEQILQMLTGKGKKVKGIGVLPLAITALFASKDLIPKAIEFIQKIFAFFKGEKPDMKDAEPNLQELEADTAYLESDITQEPTAPQPNNAKMTTALPQQKQQQQANTGQTPPSMPATRTEEQESNNTALTPPQQQATTGQKDTTNNGLLMAAGLGLLLLSTSSNTKGKKKKKKS